TVTLTSEMKRYAKAISWQKWLKNDNNLYRKLPACEMLYRKLPACDNSPPLEGWHEVTGW
ncbi:MAG TPA: hypothetical protein PK816_16120, partial [Candidatus Cloacimonadota bacterium]|nr:hypothetical protein [Candidatus Cloacimonadota bacterium]